MGIVIHFRLFGFDAQSFLVKVTSQYHIQASSLSPDVQDVNNTSTHISLCERDQVPFVLMVFFALHICRPTGGDY